jgi:hypothetical protein
VTTPAILRTSSSGSSPNGSTRTALKVNESNSQSPINKASREDQDQVLDLTDRAQRVTTLREYSKTLGENIDADIAGQSYLSTGIQFAKSLIPSGIPGSSAYNLHNALQGKNFASSWLPGSNLGEGVDYLMRLPYPEAQARLKAAVDEIKKSSNFDAKTLVDAVQQYTSMESVVNNAVGAADVAGLGSLAGKGVLKAVRGAGALADRVSLARAAAQRAAAPATVETRLRLLSKR